jgi:hypothetical protein
VNPVSCISSCGEDHGASVIGTNGECLEGVKPELGHRFVSSGRKNLASSSFIYLAVCLTTGPKPLPKQALHIVRSRASSFRSGYPILSLRSSSSFLRLLPRLPVTYILPFIFPSITCRSRQLLRKM